MALLDRPTALGWLMRQSSSVTWRRGVRGRLWQPGWAPWPLMDLSVSLQNALPSDEDDKDPNDPYRALDIDLDK